MIALSIFYLFLMMLLLFIIPLLKRLLNDYASMLEMKSKKAKATKINMYQQELNLTIEKRWQQLETHLSSSESYPTENLKSEEFMQSFKVYLQSILKIFKSDENSY